MYTWVRQKHRGLKLLQCFLLANSSLSFQLLHLHSHSNQQYCLGLVGHQYLLHLSNDMVYSQKNSPTFQSTNFLFARTNSPSLNSLLIIEVLFGIGGIKITQKVPFFFEVKCPHSYIHVKSALFTRCPLPTSMCILRP